MISENDKIKTNSLSAWVLAARPKTLTGAMVPVMIGTAWAWKLSGGENFRVVPAILCFLFAFLYTTCFSYLGLGDVLVLVFFGIVPVVFTTYVILPNHSQAICFDVIISGVICGLVIDTLLVVNNYRDRDNDKRDGKITLVVRVGEEEAEKLYLALGLMAYIQLSLLLSLEDRHNLLTFILLVIIFAPYNILHYKTAMQMRRIKKGKDLNLILAQTARNMLIYGIATTIAIIGS